ncbi:MAG TPA: hypothetical protein VMA34_07355 [Terracidiphilus sp.]|nr:hypothetical protein [Terracidiphilus sp.]
MPHFDVETVQIVVLALVALAVLLQVVLVIAIFFAVGKTGKAVKQEFEDLRSSLMPSIYNSRDLLAATKPKIEAAVEDLAVLVHSLRSQSEDVKATGTEILERLRKQSIRLDSMITELLDAVDRASVAVADAVNRPVRQISGFIATAKAVVESLRDSASAPPSSHPPQPHPTPGDRGLLP